MKIIIRRCHFTPTYTEGKLYLSENTKILYSCDTLEPTCCGLCQGDSVDKIKALKCKCPKSMAIPSGEYDAMIHYPSKKFRGERVCLLGVPAFSGILIHEGNTVADTEGCILVGRKRANGILENSRKVLAGLWAAIAALDKIKVRLCDCPAPEV